MSPLYQWLVEVQEQAPLGHAANTAFAGVDTLLGLWRQTAVSGAQFLEAAGGSRTSSQPTHLSGYLAPFLQCSSALRLSIPSRQ